jgi:hypothetical protein
MGLMFFFFSCQRYKKTPGPNGFKDVFFKKKKKLKRKLWGILGHLVVKAIRSFFGSITKVVPNRSQLKDFWIAKIKATQAKAILPFSCLLKKEL